MMRTHAFPAWITACGLLALGACGGGGGEPAGREAPAAPEPTGSIAGVISYSGGEDPDTVIDMSSEPNCQALHREPVTTRRLVTDGAGHLANVFVYIASGLGERRFPVPEGKVVLDQSGCLYHPHVFGIRTGQTLVVRNSDETVHHVHGASERNEGFDRGQPFPGMEMERTFHHPDVMVHIMCEIHPWMSAYAGVLDHPFFAVTGADGSFSMEGVPPGTYTVTAWHEELGTHSARVAVPAGGTADLSFDYAARAGGELEPPA